MIKKSFPSFIRSILITGLFLVVVHGSTSWGQTQAPVRIEIIHADEMIYDGNKHTMTYAGSVHIVRGTMDLRADEIVLILTENEREVDHAFAEGHVVIVDGTRRATAGYAEFKETDQTVVLTKDPRLYEGENELIAEKVIYDLSRRYMRAVGNVRGTFFPSSSQEQ